MSEVQNFINDMPFNQDSKTREKERIAEIAAGLTNEQVAEKVQKIKEEVAEKKKKVKASLEYDDFICTDLGNSRGFIKDYGWHLLYCTVWNMWLAWQETHWRRDENQIVNSLAKEFVKSLYNSAFLLQDKKLSQHAFRSASRSKIEAMISLARSEPGVPALPEFFDKNKYLLNLKNGTFDLKENKLKAHHHDDFITKLAAIEYDQNAECPKWLKFLNRIMNGDESLIVFLQCAVGYALTGDTSEQVLFILYGTGNNGKSTFIETVAALLGDYAVNTPTETLLIKRDSGIPNDVARLSGARLVYAIEAEANRRLAESLVKQMTGGDTISARFLHQEFFQFVPEFKIFLATNHRPVVYGQDHAIWRRIKMIPFEVEIPEPERDRHLKEKLREELPGILNWALEGCADWIRNGLSFPEKVQQTTQEYKTKMDILGDFLSEWCDVDVPDQEQSSILYRGYRSWCEENGEKKSFSQTKFSLLLEERGFQKEKTRNGAFWLGIRLKGLKV